MLGFATVLSGGASPFRVEVPLPGAAGDWREGRFGYPVAACWRNYPKSRRRFDHGLHKWHGYGCLRADWSWNPLHPQGEFGFLYILLPISGIRVIRGSNCAFWDYTDSRSLLDHWFGQGHGRPARDVMPNPKRLWSLLLKVGTSGPLVRSLNNGHACRVSLTRRSS